MRLLTDERELATSIRTATAELQHASPPSAPQSEATEKQEAAHDSLWAARVRIRGVMTRHKLYPAGRIVHCDCDDGAAAADDGGMRRPRAVYADQAVFDALILSGE